MPEISDKQLAKIRSLLSALQDAFDSLESGEELLTDELRERIRQFQAAEKCLYCELPLEDERPRRGCHPSCYNLLNQRIFRGQLTRRAAIEKGWLNPIADKPGRRTRRPDPMRQAKAGAKVRIAEIEAEFVKDQTKPVKKKKS